MAGLIGVWRDFFGFLRRPTAIAPSGFGVAGAWGGWVAMALLHAIGVIAAGFLVSAWGEHFGIKSPEAFGQIPKYLLFPVAAIIAPPIEEALFRGWLTGRPRALWLMGCAAAFLVMIVAMALFPGKMLTTPLYARRLFTLALLVIGLIGWFRLRWQPGSMLTPVFAPVFYASALIFAVIHGLNFDLRHGWPIVVMVLPQLWTGLTLGYVRMRIGLPGSILLHMLNNALAIGLLLAGFAK